VSHLTIGNQENGFRDDATIMVPERRAVRFTVLSTRRSREAAAR
jgi:hypothetical protein